MTVGQALRAALARNLQWGWLYLPDVHALTSESPCVLVDDPNAELDEHHRPVLAVRAGFPREGVDTDTLEATGDCAKAMEDPPSDDLLLESFNYYRRFDSFLPSPGAPDPPTGDELQLGLDRDFCELLGQEREDHRCKREGCRRGAITLSVLCRKHHFEDIRGRPYPFDD